MLPSVAGAATPSNVSAAPSGMQPEHERVGVVLSDEKKFSDLSAEDLIEVLVGKIATIPIDGWIKEDLSGPAILESVEPSALSEILESVQISSKFMRSRVTDILLALIEKDDIIMTSVKSG